MRLSHAHIASNKTAHKTARPHIQRTVRPHNPPKRNISLQRHLGNQQYSQISSMAIQRKCSCGGSCTSCSGRKDEMPIQTKLTVGSPNDRYEKEADRVADQVVQTPDPHVQRQAVMEDIPEDENKIQAKPLASQITPFIQRTASNSGPSAPISHLPKSNGQPLRASTRSYMEPRFGVNFGNVRVHSGGAAERTAAQLQARAFTNGTDIWLGRGAKETDHCLMAHELTHVIQQTGVDQAHTIQRITVDGNCASEIPEDSTAAQEMNDPDIPASDRPAPGNAGAQQAWNKATELTREVIERLRGIRSLIPEEGGPDRFIPTQTAILRKTFGDVGGLSGNSTFSRIDTVIGDFERILSALSANAFTLRCTSSDDSECGGYLGAYVRRDVPDVIFICPDLFFAKGLNQRAETIIHELAHTELSAEHEGSGGLTEDATPPPMVYDCGSEGFGLEFSRARNNAYVYDTLVACLVGSFPSPTQVTAEAPASTENNHEEEDHPLNEIGAYVLIPTAGGAGFEARYTRIFAGHQTGFQFLGAGGVSYLSHGDTAGIGLGLGLRYQFPYVYLQAGGGLEGNAAFTPEHGTSPVLNLSGFGEAEAGVSLGMVRLSAGYRLLVPITNFSDRHLEHIVTGGVSLDF